MEKKPKANQGASANPNNPTKTSREELRTKEVRVNAPRESNRPVERSGQTRHHRNQS